MPAKNKSELMKITQRDFDKLLATTAGVSPALSLQKDTDGTSIKDVIAHRAHWIDLFLGWHAAGQAGKSPAFPAEGYKWNDLKRYNADLRRHQSHLGWEEARALLQDAHDRLSAFLESQNDNALYGAPMKGAKNDWTTGRWAEASGASHYRSAAKYIRARIRLSDKLS